MENKEIRILLTEATFSNAIKRGFISYNINNEGSMIEFPLTSFDVREICNGKILMRKINDDLVVKVALQDIGKETIKEILKRSPIFSSLSEEII